MGTTLWAQWEESMKKEILRLENITKKINNVKVIKNVSLSIYEGEIVKLFGDEGQSKSILVRLLGGDFRPDFGKIYVDGREVSITSPYVGKKLGISIIHKKSDLIPNLTVMENLFLGRSDPRIKPFFRARQQLERTRELLNILGLNIAPQTLTAELTPEQIQMVQLGKALLDDPKVVVMDHTNIVLGQTQIKLFERVFKELKKAKSRYIGGGAESRRLYVGVRSDVHHERRQHRRQHHDIRAGKRQGRSDDR